MIPLSSMAHVYNIYVLDCCLSIQPDKQNSTRESAPPSKRPVLYHFALFTSINPVPSPIPTT